MSLHAPTERPGDGLRAEGVSVLIRRALTPDIDDSGRRRREIAESALTAWRAALPPTPPPPVHGSVTAEAGNCRINKSNCGAACTSDRALLLWLELEERCNLDCLFCYNPWRPSGTDPDARPMLEQQRLLDIVTALMSELPVGHVTLSGGEPLMYPGILDVVRSVASWAPVINITTNGRSATRARLNSLAAAGLSQLAVPVHSHDPAVHDSLTGASSWHAAVRALALGRELGLDVTMSAVITRRNADHVDRICRIVELLGLDSLVLNCFHPTGQGLLNTDALAITPTAFDEVCTAAHRMLDGHAEVAVGSPAVPSPGTPPGSPPAPTPPPTRASIDRLVLSPYGDVKFCNQSVHGVVNVAAGEPDEWPEILAQLRSADHGPLLERVDGCTCLGAVG